MLQHNPHRHSIRCAGLNVTLDAFATRELASDEVSGVPCVECDCVLMLDEKPKKAAAKSETPEAE